MKFELWLEKRQTMDWKHRKKTYGLRGEINRRRRLEVQALRQKSQTPNTEEA